MNSEHGLDLDAVKAGNISLLIAAAGRLVQLAQAARPVQAERTRQLEVLKDQVAQHASALDQANREIARLRRENHQAARRAYKLQPGLRVKVGAFEGTVQEEPVMVPVLLDGQFVTGRFGAEFVHVLSPAEQPSTARTSAAFTNGAPVTFQVAEASNIRLTLLDERGDPVSTTESVPFVPVERPEPVDVERPPFHHQPGDASDYLEALSEEIHHGPRRPLRMETVAVGHVLKIHISFDVPDRRGELTDLLFVAEK